MQVQGQSLLLGDPQLKGKDGLQVIFSWVLCGRSGCSPPFFKSTTSDKVVLIVLFYKQMYTFGQKNNSSLSQIKSNKKESRFVINRIFVK